MPPQLSSGAWWIGWSRSNLGDRRRANVKASLADAMPMSGPRGPSSGRRHVLQAFLDSVAEAGLSGSTLADVAERVGIPASQSIREFRDFEDLMLQALETGLAAFAAYLEQVSITGGTVEERLECLARVVADFYDRPGYSAVLQLELDLTRNPVTAERAAVIVAGAVWPSEPALYRLVGLVFEDAVPPSRDFSRFVSSSVRALARSHALDRASVGKADERMCPDQILQRRWMVQGLAAVYRDLSVGKVPPPRLGP